MNHVHIGTKDLEQSIHFYTSFFNFKKKFDHGEGIFLEDDKGFLLAIDPVDEIPLLPSWFHFGFCVSNKNTVKDIYESMSKQGVHFTKPYQEFGEDAAAFYALDPDGYQIEVSWHSE